MRYGRLLSVSLKHSYYKDGLCPDFAVIPTKDTEALLRNHRCVVKSKANGINIYVPASEAKTPMIQFADGTRLSFDLRLKNPEFSLFTDFVRLPGDGDFRMTYPHRDKPAADIFANIEIQRDFNRIDGTPPDMGIAFSAKPVRWVYYFVTNQGTNDSDFSITSVGQELPGLAWKQIAPLAFDGISKMLAEEYPGMRWLRFVSGQEIPCRESGLKSIQLSFGQNRIFENLPTPSFRNYYQTNIDGSSNQADAIFTIVKCITNTTLTKV